MDEFGGLLAPGFENTPFSSLEKPPNKPIPRQTDVNLPSQQEPPPSKNQLEMVSPQGEPDPSENSLVSISICGAKVVENKYTVYLILVASDRTEWVVCRRFSEFELLHAQLSASVPRVMLPPLPPKPLLQGSTDDSVVSERRVWLQRYLQSLQAVPTLAHSPHLAHFLAPELEYKDCKLNNTQLAPGAQRFLDEIDSATPMMPVHSVSQYTEMPSTSNSTTPTPTPTSVASSTHAATRPTASLSAPYITSNTSNNANNANNTPRISSTANFHSTRSSLNLGHHQPSAANINNSVNSGVSLRPSSLAVYALLGSVSPPSTPRVAGASNKWGSGLISSLKSQLPLSVKAPPQHQYTPVTLGSHSSQIPQSPDQNQQQQIQQIPPPQPQQQQQQQQQRSLLRASEEEAIKKKQEDERKKSQEERQQQQQQQQQQQRHQQQQQQQLKKEEDERKRKQDQAEEEKQKRNEEERTKAEQQKAKEETERKQRDEEETRRRKATDEQGKQEQAVERKRKELEEVARQQQMQQQAEELRKQQEAQDRALMEEELKKKERAKRKEEERKRKEEEKHQKELEAKRKLEEEERQRREEIEQRNRREHEEKKQRLQEERRKREEAVARAKKAEEDRLKREEDIKQRKLEAERVQRADEEENTRMALEAEKLRKAEQEEERRKEEETKLEQQRQEKLRKEREDEDRLFEKTFGQKPERGSDVPKSVPPSIVTRLSSAVSNVFTTTNQQQQATSPLHAHSYAEPKTQSTQHPRKTSGGAAAVAPVTFNLHYTEWKEYTTEDGKKYYHNNTTNSTTWSREEVVMSEWIEVVNPSPNSPSYFYNPVTAMTTWDCPAGLDRQAAKLRAKQQKKLRDIRELERSRTETRDRLKECEAECKDKVEIWAQRNHTIREMLCNLNQIVNIPTAVQTSITVTVTTPAPEVRRAYRKAMLLVHPDKQPDSMSPEEISLRTLVFDHLTRQYALFTEQNSS